MRGASRPKDAAGVVPAARQRCVFHGTPMPKFKAKSGAIHFEHRGSRADPRVVLLHGLGCQLVQWPAALLDGLVARGLCVVTFDNRDAGLSDGPETPPPSVEALLAAQHDPAALAPAYILSDMAQDVVDLLDHLGQAGAHMVGFSMGGMIAQRLAVEHAERVYSLTSVMSSPGGDNLPAPDETAVAALLGLVLEDDAKTPAARVADAWEAFGGPHFPSSELGIGRYAARAVQRAWRPAGTARQLAAILADGDRRGALGAVKAPTLVLHGEADPLVPVAAGQATAAAVPNAKFVGFEKLGHDFPAPLIGSIVAAIGEHVEAVEVSR